MFIKMSTLSYALMAGHTLCQALPVPSSSTDSISATASVAISDTFSGDFISPAEPMSMSMSTTTSTSQAMPTPLMGSTDGMDGMDDGVFQPNSHYGSPAVPPIHWGGRGQFYGSSMPVQMMDRIDEGMEDEANMNEEPEQIFSGSTHFTNGIIIPDSNATWTDAIAPTQANPSSSPDSNSVASSASTSGTRHNTNALSSTQARIKPDDSTGNSITTNLLPIKLDMTLSQLTPQTVQPPAKAQINEADVMPSELLNLGGIHVNLGLRALSEGEVQVTAGVQSGLTASEAFTISASTDSGRAEEQQMASARGELNSETRRSRLRMSAVQHKRSSGRRVAESRGGMFRRRRHP